MAALPSMLVVASLDERDENTLRFAAQLAAGLQTRSVALTHVACDWERPPYWTWSEDTPTGDDDHDLEVKLSQLVSTAQRLFARATPIEGSLCKGSIVHELARMAHARSTDLVVIGKRSRTQPDRVASAFPAIVRQTPCSVLLVPETSSTIERVLVPIDFSDRSADAVKLALQITKSPVVCQHVYHVPSGYHKTGRSHEEFAASMREEAERHAGQWLSEQQIDRERVQLRFDLSDDVPAAIQQAADEIKADLVVIASHGRTIPSGLLLGHVADQIVGESRHAVLCLKRKGEIVRLLQAIGELFELS